MNIVYCIPQLYNAGGMERVLTQKVNFLAAQPGMHITVVTTELPPHGRPAVFFPLHADVRLVELGLDFDADFRLPLLRKYINHNLKQRLYRKKLRQLLLDSHADVCISLCGKEVDWLWRLDVPCRKMAEVHFAMEQREQLLMQYHKGLFWRMLGRIRTRRLQRAVSRLECLVVLTKADESHWNKAGVTNTLCIPNPSPLQPSGCGTHALRQVLAVGRLHPQKGFDLLLRAWAKVAPEHTGWTLRIVGEGDERHSLEALAEQLSVAASVSMPGLSSDIRTDYLNSAVFVLSSRYEGLPLALIEAMSCGCCCIAFNCPQGPAELIDNCTNGFLVPCEDVDSLAAAIDRCIVRDDERGRVGGEAYRYAVTHFALEPVMQMWMKLLKT